MTCLTRRTVLALLCGFGLLTFSGCVIRILNNDSRQADLHYKVSQNGNVLAEGDLAFGESVDVPVSGQELVTVYGKESIDGYTDEVYGFPARVLLEWTGGFEFGVPFP